MPPLDVNTIESWLKTILNKQVDQFKVNIDGTSDKGDGYSGDIIFVSLTHNTENKKLDVVLKCSKDNEVLRKNIPVKECYLNEIYLYDKIFPTFMEFQLQRGITDVFNSVPKFYGSLCLENSEIIVLENLKKSGYTLWNKKKPLTRKHIEMVLNNYAKFHGVSIAMKDQDPKKLEELHAGLYDTFDQMARTSSWSKTLATGVDEIYNVLQGELDESILEKWKKFKDDIDYVFTDMVKNHDGLKVILHGDSWCNNFLFKHDNGDESKPLNIAVLDWQMSKYSSPVLDLSYFIFASISKEDLESLDDILLHYHNSLRKFVHRLGSDLDKLYPLDVFLNEWRNYCKYGVGACCAILKICATEKDEVVDIDKNAEDFSEAFRYDVRDKTCFRDRTKPIVKYAVENKLI